jgi:translation initiation factor 1
MSDICAQCGLPSDLCVCETIAKESQRIEVTTEKRKFGKIYTVIKGVGKGVDLDDLAKKLKNEFACGGTVKGTQVELQGNHMQKAKQVLVKLGFPEETIDIK